MKTIFIFLFSLMIFSFHSFTQTYEWTETAGGVNGDAVKSIATDQAGNVYYTGYYTGNFDFDGSAGVDLHACAGSFDFFVVKKDASGNYLWCKTWGNAGSDRAFSVDVDALGNIIIGGSFQNTLDFDLGAGTATYTPTGSYDGFILKLNSNGNFIWVKTFGGTGSSVWPLSLQCDGSGNIVSAGFYQNAAIDIDPSANITTLPFYGGAQDIYVQKLDANGNYLWSASAGGAGVDKAYSLALDNNGNSYVAGYFQNTVDFNTGAGLNNQTASSDDGFLLKLDANGNYVNCVTSAGASAEQFTSVAYSASDNTVVLAGYFQGTLDFNYGAGTDSKTVTGSSDGFVQKLDLALNHSWVKNIGGPNAIRTLAVTLDNAGNIYSSGRFNTTVDLDPGAGTDTKTSNGIFDVFLQKLNPLGTYSWGLSFGGIDVDEPSYLLTHNSGALYLSGIYNNTVDFNPFVAVNSKTSLGVDDGFISKFSFCTSSSNTITVNACGSQTVNNQTYTSSGVYTQLLTNVNGCDSTLTINLTISSPNAPTGLATQTFCNNATVSNLSATGTSIQWYAIASGGSPLAGSTALVNGATYYASQTVSGCESATRLAVTLTLNTAPEAPVAVNWPLDFCFNGSVQQYSVPPVDGASSYVWTTPNGSTGSSTSNSISLLFSPNFQYGDLAVQAQNECGLSPTTFITLNQHFPSTSSLNVTACNSYVFNGQTYTQSGTYNYQGSTTWGCDSTVILNLTIAPVVTQNISDEACGSYTWNGQSYFNNGSYTDTLQTLNGCDSIVTLDLTIHPITSITLDSAVVDSFNWNETVYTSSGTYTQFFTSAFGCDSTVTINLTVSQSGLSEEKKHFNIYPNPVGEHRQLFIQDLNGTVHFRIRDIQGKITEEGITDGTILILDSLNFGIYYLELENQVFKFVLE